MAASVVCRTSESSNNKRPSQDFLGSSGMSPDDEENESNNVYSELLPPEALGLSTPSCSEVDDDVFDSIPVKIPDSILSDRPLRALPASSSPENPSCITLLEKLIKCHSIWYLPHMGRIAAVHLLRNQKPGTFLVRYSSQPNSMALSVKLPKNNSLGIDVEHFLIETTSNGVRLEGSSNLFPLLPVLIAHYFEHGDELPSKLTLPKTIMDCDSRRDLASLALLGQEFWSSEHCLNKASRSAFPISHENASPLTKPCRSFSLSACPNSSSRRPSVQNNSGPKVGANKRPAFFTNFKSARSSSVSSEFKQTDKNHVTVDKSSSNENKLSDKKFCWRSWFESKRPGTTSNSSKDPSSTWYRTPALSTSSIINCADDKSMNTDLFFQEPRYVSGVLNSETDFLSKIESKSTQDLSNIANYVNCPNDLDPKSQKLVVEESRKVDRMLDDDDLFNSPHLPKKSSNLFTFKPNSAKIGAENNSENNTLNKNQQPIIKNSQKSNLKGSLSFNVCLTDEQIDSGNKISTKNDQETDDSFKNCVEELRKRRLECAQVQKSYIKNTNSASSANSSQNSTAKFYRSKRDGSPHVLNRENSVDSKTKKIAQLLQLRKNDNKLLRRKPPTRSTAERVIAQMNRLSAPNLIENSPSSLKNAGRNVSDIVNELKMRQSQRTGAAGTNLHTINEGLATPIANRKDSRKVRLADFVRERRLSRSADDLGKEAEDQTAKNKSMFYTDNDSRTISDQKKATENHSSSLSVIKRHKKFAFFSSSTAAKCACCFESDYGLLKNFNSHISSSDENAPSGDPSDCSYGVISGTTMPYHNHKSADRSSGGTDNDWDDSRSVISAAGTLFSEPWDSSTWESLLDMASSLNGRREIGPSSDNLKKKPEKPLPPKPVLKHRQDSVAQKDSLTLLDGDLDKKATPTVSGSDPAQPAPAVPDKTDKIPRLNLPLFLSSPNWEEFSNQVLSSSTSTITTMSNSLEKRAKPETPTSPFLPSLQVDGGAIPPTLPPPFDTLANVSEILKTPPTTLIKEYDKFALGPVLSPVRFRDSKHKHRSSADPSFRIQQCVEKLSKDTTTFFGIQVKHFIDCTLQARETDPHVVVGNVRQFMNGIKNYLVKHGERDLHNLIEHERSKLNLNEFLNIDAILEGVLQKIILQQLKSHLYHVLVKESSRNGTLQLLSENFAVVRSKSPEDLGLKAANSEAVINERVRSCLRKMQNQYSPLKKLENLLHALSIAYQAARSHLSPDGSGFDMPSGDELLKWFVFIVSRCSMVGCEIEAAYMAGLLHPALLSGEASYYLAAFSSAVYVLKHLDLLPKKLNPNLASFGNNEGRETATSEGILKIAIPNESTGSISYHNFPLAPQLTVAKFCRMIAHKCGVTNPEDHGLYLLVDGFETCLLPSECPYLVNEQLQMAGAPRMFAYKRHEAKIAWPKQAVSP